MASKIEIVGLGSLEKDLRNLRDKITKKELAKMIRPGANIIKKAVDARTPVDTGVGKKALTVKVARGKKDDPYATLLVTFGKVRMLKGKYNGEKIRPYYLYFVHNGTVVGVKNRKHRRSTMEARLKLGGRVGIRPRPFVYEAFEAKAQEVADVILTKIENSL